MHTHKYFISGQSSRTSSGMTSGKTSDTDSRDSPRVPHDSAPSACQIAKLKTAALAAQPKTVFRPTYNFCIQYK